MKKEKISLLIVPPDGGKILSLNLTKNFQLFLLFFILLVFLGGIIFLIQRIEIYYLHKTIFQLNQEIDYFEIFSRKIYHHLEQLRLQQVKFAQGTELKSLQEKLLKEKKITLLSPEIAEKWRRERLKVIFYQLKKLSTARLHCWEEVEKNLRSQIKFIQSIPSFLPVKGRVSSRFGRRWLAFRHRISHHRGIDLVAPIGSKILAPAEGVVIKAGYDRKSGYYLEIKHKYGFSTFYAHNKKNLVKKGSKVKKGEVIALLGNTGRTTGPHLHYEIRIYGRPVNPLLYNLE